MGENVFGKFNTRMILFVVVVREIILYGSEIWEKKRCQKIERLYCCYAVEVFEMDVTGIPAETYILDESNRDEFWINTAK